MYGYHVWSIVVGLHSPEFVFGIFESLESVSLSRVKLNIKGLVYLLTHALV